MADAAADPLGMVVPFERYRDVEVAGLHVRLTVPDDILETGSHGVAPTVVVYEVVDGERGRFVANVFRLDAPPALGRFNVRIEPTLDTADKDAVVALAWEWWRRRLGWRAPGPRR